MSRPEPAREPRHGMREALEWASYYLVASVILWVPKLLDISEILLGLAPLLFMAYVLRKSHKARRARRAREADEILDAGHTVRMCEIALDELGGLAESTGDPRTRVALERLYYGIGLLTSRYRRYLDDDAARSALEAEEYVLRAELGAEHRIAARVAPVGDCLKAVRDGILDVDHQSLDDERGAV